MVAWMGYAVAVGVVLSAAGWLMERGVRGLGLPVRWVWLVVLATTAGLPVLAAISAFAAAPPVAPLADPTATPTGSTTDALVLLGWAAASLVLYTSLRLSAWTLQRNERSWRTVEVDGQAVRLSTGFGPGVIGAVRPRVVLPAWVPDTDDWLRRLVVRHEAEHVRARDPALLLAGLALAVAVPWCVPVWWQLQRLREAVETDCDARVLGRSSPREYAHALVAIAARRTGRRLPVPALSLRPAELERRIRLITAGSRGSRPVALTLVCLALAVAMGLGGIPRPAAAPSPILPTVRWERPTVPGTAEREAKVFLSVEPG